ncbi:MAG: N-(5'-phosphoribosyl)anthranilate isomerase [candidate division Zixibacteria bacterium]|nr:N-(5'-phosphoribosyl)anthranilate isomerase [candidate division Zixibacteria bacterium]
MQRTRIKLCGITRLADALAAQDAGCDAVGFVFWHGSSRCIGVDDVTQIVQKLSSMMTTVGVFVSPTPDEVLSTCQRAGLTAAQLCGDLPDGHWTDISKQVRLIRSVSSGHASDRLDWTHDLLVDSHTDDQPGGTGQTFDWSALSHGHDDSLRIWLAGGLHPGNVGEAVKRVHPFAVDVSTGVEDRPGIKSHDKIGEFVAAVHAADLATQRD